MRLLRRISAFICMFLVLAVGFMLFYAGAIYFSGVPMKAQVHANLNTYMDKLAGDSQTQVITFMVGLLLLLVGLITLYLAIADIHSSGRIRLDSYGGRLTISVSAIEDHLSRIARDIEGVKELRPRIRRTPTGWGLFARVTVWSDQNVQVINEKIREHVKIGITQIIGEHSIEPIDIHITKIAEQRRVGTRRPVDIEFTS